MEILCRNASTTSNFRIDYYCIDRDAQKHTASYYIMFHVKHKQHKAIMYQIIITSNTLQTHGKQYTD